MTNEDVAGSKLTVKVGILANEFESSLSIKNLTTIIFRYGFHLLSFFKKCASLAKFGIIICLCIPFSVCKFISIIKRRISRIRKGTPIVNIRIGRIPFFSDIRFFEDICANPLCDSIIRSIRAKRCIT